MKENEVKFTTESSVIPETIGGQGFQRGRERFMSKTLLARSRGLEFITGALPLRTNKNTSWMGIWDNHYPFDLFRDSLFNLADDFTPDYFILGGDNLDNSVFNHWNKNKPGKAKFLPDPKEYYEQANEEFFKPLRKALGKKTIILYIQGNHENWSYRAIDEFPDLRGYVEVENNIEKGLIDYFIPNKKMISLGEQSFAHGDNLLKESVNHTQKMSIFHRKLIYGHYHDRQRKAIEVPNDEKRLHVDSVGCLTVLNPSYSKNAPNNRSHGFAHGIITPNGDSHAQFPEIINGEFYFNGRKYLSKQTQPKEVGYEI